jgi:flagellar motor switch protein FliN/FliY
VTSTSNQIALSLTEHFAAQLGRVFETLAGDRIAFSVQCAGEQPGTAGRLIWRQPFSNVDGAFSWVSASASAATAIGSHLLLAAGVQNNDKSSVESRFFEAISEAFSALASDLSARLELDLTCRPGAESEQAPQSEWFTISCELEGRFVALDIAFDAQLLNLFEQAAPGKTPAKTPKTLDLLLDVELPVSVSFGRAQLALKDVIKLTTGSIVELNRTIAEPVEVIVNNCVIARGEVVVVDGNFGVRIQQVISRQERLRTLS